jgi:lysozyme
LAYDDARPNYVLKAGDKILGTLSNGYGHTGPDVFIGQVATEVQINNWFRKDTAWAVDAANSSITLDDIEQNKFDAWVSAIYNCGIGKKGGKDGLIILKSGEPSTALKMINSKQFDKFGPALMQWVHSPAYPPGGPGDPGLIVRRGNEVAQWNGSDFVSSSNVQVSVAVSPWKRLRAKIAMALGLGVTGQAANGLGDTFNGESIKQAADYAQSLASSWHIFGYVAGVLSGAVVVWMIFGARKHD